MSVGSMRHKVALQERVRTSDGAGGAESAWETVANVWCSIVPRSASERFRSMKIEDAVTHVVTMRYRSDFNTTWRVNYGGRLFNVIQVLNKDEKGKYLDVLLQEGVVT